MDLDIDFVRAQFPAFSEPSLKGQAFFENAGGSYACGPVIDRLTRFYRERKVQPYAPYAASRLGGEEMDEARARIAAHAGGRTDEVSFGPSTTQNTYVLAQAFRQWLKPGDAIVVTDQDHEANSGPGGGSRARDRGPRMGDRPRHGASRPGGARHASGRREAVCFPHCSNVVGEINPVAEIVAKAHAAGAVTCVDGVSYAPHGFPDVGRLGADIYLFSAYKTYGPHQGIMVIRRALGEVSRTRGIPSTAIRSTSGSRRRGRTTRRSRPRRAWRITSTRFMRGTSTTTPSRPRGPRRCTT
jgi:selenocysteine lyase/cysteine desulfurase